MKLLDLKLDGKNCGLYTEFYSTGQIQSMKYYSDNKKLDIFTWYLNGSLWTSESFYNNEKNGWQKHYSVKGIIEKETLWEIGKEKKTRLYNNKGELTCEYIYIEDGETITKINHDNIFNWE